MKQVSSSGRVAGAPRKAMVDEARDGGGDWVVEGAGRGGAAWTMEEQPRER
jgi:hypothetical protein